ncbi:unnamed protein product [Brassicogethes aeneus]|uniref:Active breakpoint cluster region-related protein n=1 Tax=Brassicogethes aeneus TaxID=1431903 RepID=A0A9P0AM75_BRAAE|nr:unnamed protein product [Brassicogethes aeneus]
MSVFCDFQQVWLQRFPESPLPGAWEEDVRANLAKHKQKVSLLKEELEKEEFYVEYLERLLNDVELHKKKLAKEKPDENCEEIGDVTTDTISKNESMVTPPTTPLNNDETEVFSANMCVNEISNQMTTSYAEKPIEPTTPEADSGTFVTVIEVNGLKQQSTASPVKLPPKLPARPESLKNLSKEKNRSRNSDSISSSSELIDEPFYDMVAPEEEECVIQSNHSSTENVFSSSSTLPLGSKRESTQTIQEPQSPGTSNYVNIEYFIQSTKKNGNDHSSSDEEHEEVAELKKNNADNVSYASSSSLESMTPSTRRKFLNENDIKEAERLSMYKSIIQNIIDSESNYVEWLNVLIRYLKAIKATVSTSQPIATQPELDTIFYKIPDLFELHKNFLEMLRKHSQRWDTKIGPVFKNMASNLTIYGAFLSNYGRALDTVSKCSEANSQFSEISKNITCKHLSEQPISLEDLLHKPVARMQKNGLVLHDLIKCIPKNHPDYNSVKEALVTTQQFLDQFNMIQTKMMFKTSDRAQRRLVKNSFIVEYSENTRKLRHLFLFNDVIACAKYKSASGQKYTFELKWFIPVENIFIIEETTANSHETAPSQIVALKSQASNVRDQLRHEEKHAEEKKIRIRGTDKYRKRLLELESQLVLVSPNLVFRIRHRQNNKPYTFFLSSDFERNQWIEAILTLQRAGQPPPSAKTFTMLELQTWITACRTFLKTNMGSYLLRNSQDEKLLVGDLHLHIYEMKNVEFPCDLYVCAEVDFYGHFFQKAKTKIVCDSTAPVWNEHFIIDLEGCENLRILVYRDGDMPTLYGKLTHKLSRKWLNEKEIHEMNLMVNGSQLRVGLKFVPCEMSLRRVPSGKVGSLFGEKIQNVARRQKRNIPFIITACIREVERRGMAEIGIYRVSGSATEISKLKKSFETNNYEAEQNLKEVDIHSVTGILKLYLRELPEALFTDHLYPELLESFNQSNGNLKRRTELLKECFEKLPPQNHATIKYILDHLIKVYQHEGDNKMSLHNLATVFGPTLLRPAIKADSKLKGAVDVMAAGTVDVMAQAGILYCYLQDINRQSMICS